MMRAMNEIERDSARWIEEGRSFKTRLNGWLEKIYAGEKPSEDEPEDTRADMAGRVIEHARQLSKEGRTDELRTLFPPAHEPFDHEAIGATGVDQVLLLKDQRVVTSIGRKTFLLDGNQITEVEGVLGTARSTYHEVYGKAYSDRLDILESWDGPVLRSLPWPRDYGDSVPKGARSAQFESLEELGRLTTLSLFPDGKRALLATDSGVFLMQEEGATLLHPSAETLAEGYEGGDDEDTVNLNLDYPHGAVSPDGAVIAAGVQEPPHRLFHEIDGKWQVAAEVYPRSSYPHCALFHDAVPHVALAGCHFRSSATIGLKLDLLPKRGAEPLSLDGYDGDEALDYIDQRFWVFSMAPIDGGYVLGANNGYLWAHAFDGCKQLWFCHLGSTITALDISEDRKTLVAGTYSGQVIELRLGEGRDPAQLITDTEIKEERRWVFWPGGPPMAW
jgi:hypothetical protein